MTTSENTPDLDDRTENSDAQDTPTEQLSVDEATQELPVPDATAQLPVGRPSSEANDVEVIDTAEPLTSAVSAEELPEPGRTAQLPVEDPSTEPLGTERAETTSVTGVTGPTKVSTPDAATDPAALDWRTAEYGSAHGSGDSSGAQGNRSQVEGGSGMSPASSAQARISAAAPTDQPSAPRTDRPSTPPVWTASTAAGTPPGAGDPTTTPHRPEAPARGVRVGQLIWAGIVILMGVFLIALALLPNLDVTTALIGLVALLGVALIIAAWATSRRPKV